MNYYYLNCYYIMTQELANRIFQSELGQQVLEIFVTSDDQVFIRHQEALLHTKGELIPNTSPLEDDTITTWYENYETFFTWQFLESENLYYLVEYNEEEGVLEEWFFENKEKLDNYILENNIEIEILNDNN